MNIDDVEAVPQKSSENETAVKKNIDCEKEQNKEKTGAQEVYGWEGSEDRKGSQRGEGRGVGSWDGVREIVTVTRAAFEAQVVEA